MEFNDLRKKYKNGETLYLSNDVHEFLNIEGEKEGYYNSKELISIVNKKRIEFFYLEYCRKNDITALDLSSLDYKYYDGEPYINSMYFESKYWIPSFFTNSIHFVIKKLDELHYSIYFLENVEDMLNIFSEKKEKPNRKTYLIKDGLGFTKIGKARSPKFREKTLSSQVPTIELFAICEDDIESKLHKKYSKYKVRGEWFDLSVSLIKSIIEDNNFKIVENGK